MSLFLPLTILATGKALPSRCVLSSELDLQLGKPRGHVQKRSGMVQRYYARDDECQSDLAARALQDALARADLRPGSIDLLLSASGVQEQALPATASRILDVAGLPDGTPGFDIAASCLSFLAALHVAASLLNTGSYKRIAVVASDLASRGIDWGCAEASLIFGDGAAAAIVERGDGASGIESYLLHTYPAGKALCEIRAGGTRRNPRVGVEPSDFLFRMDGKGVFKMAAGVIDEVLERLLAQAGVGLDAIQTIVPHQASHLGMRHMVQRLKVAPGKIIDIYATHGNQVAASIPTALHEAFVTGRAGPGSRIMMFGTAAGLSVGGMVVRL
ncbi:3-oxoacyl-[acyl-carrier-protein] synthase III C-terminal domain-containing protein [Comamonas composti]|uniref:3-oxoacyl-[acyl-carrier-protein] synthase III C-terminal domain-containing protein n=1 Tax=Comamonas composti TaxID=408558 RepID=UPI00041709D5|nr:3-oxoacyl-[acyl-carrier-protein] synthase III C-terminal domain-containing protein [Comamonas composti]